MTKAPAREKETWGHVTWQQLPPELRERAVRMVAEVQAVYPSQWATMAAVAQKLGIGADRDAAEVGAPGRGR